MNTQVRHHWLIVTLHWLVAAIILAETVIGVAFLHEMPGDASKVPPLSIHMVLGLLLFVLMIIRVFARAVTPRVEESTAGNSFLDWIAGATHFLLYVFTFLVAATGITLALNSHVLQLVTGGSVAFPMLFNPFLHAALFVLFGMLVGAHTIAALYHQFVLRDNLMSRMWFAPARHARLSQSLNSTVRRST